jgi:MFS family permease
LGRFASAFGLSEANERTVKIARSYTVLSVLDHLSLMISIAFLFIYMADMLGGGPGQYMEGMALLGVLIVINMGTHTILDYPTGGIGDWIGQRYLLAGAFLTYGVSLFLLSLATPESPFSYFLIIMVMLGFGGALESGALEAWLDNNYRIAAPEDEQRVQYGVFYGKTWSLFLIVNATVMIPGGLLAALFGRAWVFQLQFVLCIGLAIASMKLIQDLPELEELREGRPSIGEYYSVLKGGLSYVFGNPFAKYVIVGLMLVASTVPVWSALIMFPVYYQYLVADFAVASFMSLITIPAIFYTERSGIWAKRFEPKKWIPRLKFVQSTVFMLLLALLMFLLPPQLGSISILTVVFPFTDIVILAVPLESLLPVLLLLIIRTVTGAFGSIETVLTQRILIDAIPTRVRNSVYSLFPTLMLLFSMPQISVFGWVITEYGVPLALIFCSMVATLGVLLMRKGLSYPIPVDEEPVGPEVVEEEVVPDEG